LTGTEWFGDHVDRWIDGFKNWSGLARESGDDEGPGSEIHWNPLHNWTKKYLHFDGPIYHNAPGRHGG
jgi:hypothetical protein